MAIRLRALPATLALPVKRFMWRWPARANESAEAFLELASRFTKVSRPG
jgi:hypothetical protein